MKIWATYSFPNRPSAVSSRGSASTTGTTYCPTVVTVAAPAIERPPRRPGTAAAATAASEPAASEPATALSVTTFAAATPLLLVLTGVFDGRPPFPEVGPRASSFMYLATFPT